jgi:hypothetical protein
LIGAETDGSSFALDVGRLAASHSMREQDWHQRLAQHVLCRAAEHDIADARMTVAAHDQEAHTFFDRRLLDSLSCPEIPDRPAAS